MDFARTIGKTDKPTGIRVRTPLRLITTRDKPLSADVDIILEDQSFPNWRKWLAQRKNLSRHIETVTGRSHVDQLQSSSDRFRTFVEMKDLMAQAAIPTPVMPDKYRGGPEFWRTPEYLPDRGDICLPQISLAPTRKDLNLPPDIMRVGLPDLTAKERSFFALKAKEEPWKRSEYLKTRKLKLAKEIALLLPKEPEMATLAIRGRMFENKMPRCLCIIPPIPITRPATIPEEEPPSEDDPSIILKIQDREFIWPRSLCKLPAQLAKADPVTWSLVFDSEIDERVEKEIVLENKGTRVIVYYWRDSFFQSNHMSFVRRGSPFFFNKTKGVVLPGETVRIQIYYLSKKRGVFTESWQFVTEPKFPAAFIFRFWGCAIDVKGSELIAHHEIDKYLDRCIRDSVVRIIIEEILSAMEHYELPEIPYEQLFSRDDFFKLRNPSYHYHPSIVMQLQKMYSDVLNENGHFWDLSLDTLRNILLEIKDVNYRRNMLIRFNDLCKQSLRPDLTRSDVASNSKYNAVYNILCSFANLFDTETKYLEEKYSKIYIQKEPSISYPEKPLLLSRSRNNLEMHDEEFIGNESEMEEKWKEEKSYVNLQPYKESLFIRIYKHLEETIERICASIDSYNNLDELHKYKICKC